MIPSAPIVGKLLLTALTSMAAIGLWKLSQFVYRDLTSPIRYLRGPKATSWIYGNIYELFNVEHTVLHEKWVKQYGNTLRFNGLFGTNRLLTMDLRAINHIITHSNDYQKSSQIRYILSQLVGGGILVAEGVEHRQQRRIMNPAFGSTQIRVLTNIFLAKAQQLRDILSSEITKDPVGTTTGARIDAVPWMSKATLDIIGLAGFSYRFDALNENEKPNELNEAFSTIFTASQKIHVFPLLQARVPLLRLIPTERAQQIKTAYSTMVRIGKELVSNAKAAARANATENDEIEKNNQGGRDLLSLLVKANMGIDIPAGQRLSDEDALAQIPTFLVAGHETTSAATTWALYSLAIAPEIQNKLREELLTVETETPSMDELVALPYLDAIVRETLRMHAPAPSTQRIAMKDDEVPVDKPFTDKYGVVHNSISIRKGDSVFISILAINQSQELWGPDASEFKPERWQNVPEAALQIPGVWGNQLTFFGGPKACIGFRFSVVELKALLFTLVRAFEFELAVPASQFGKRSLAVQRPMLIGDPDRKGQLPLLFKLYKPM